MTPEGNGGRFTSGPRNVQDPYPGPPPPAPEVYGGPYAGSPPDVEPGPYQEPPPGPDVSGRRYDPGYGANGPYYGR
jgi:hypothetical protein